MSWDTAKLGEICDFQGGSQPPKSEFIYEPKEGYVRFLQIRDFKSDKNITYIPEAEKNRICLDNDILIGRYGASVGQIHKGKSGAYNVALMKTIPDESLICKDWLYAYLCSDLFQKPLSKVSARAAQRGFSKNDISDFDVLLPPLSVQKQIVEKLDAAFADIDKASSATEKNIENAEALFDSSLSHFFGCFTYPDSPKKLSDITEFIIDCEHKTAPTQDSGIPLIRTPNIQKGTLVLDSAKRISQETYEAWTRRGKPDPGDLILAREAPAGNVGVVPDGSIVCLGQRTVLIRVKREFISPDFLCYLLLHPLVQKVLLSKSTGATVQHINMRDIRNLPLPVIPNKKAQTELVQSILKILELRGVLIASLNKKNKLLGNLKSALLNQAFSGELSKDAA
jgi:type I restriction enzyme, S subunit